MSTGVGFDAENSQAVVREIDERLVLDDPAAAGMLMAVAKHNCQNTLTLQLDRVAHFKERAAIRGFTADDVVITLINVDDEHGGPLADMLMPNHDWQAHRDANEIPFARGLSKREGIQLVLETFDLEAAEKLKNMTELAVVVVDHGVAEVYPA
ncbi:MAG TPA: hypothetical protein VN086_00905 [Candidatus Paceibacterota bacterium]|nr:hypothetical protein [Candidatus Paceibacterota bacterium]